MRWQGSRRDRCPFSWLQMWQAEDWTYRKWIWSSITIYPGEGRGGLEPDPVFFWVFTIPLITTSFENMPYNRIPHFTIHISRFTFDIPHFTVHISHHLFYFSHPLLSHFVFQVHTRLRSSRGSNRSSWQRGDGHQPRV